MADARWYPALDVRWSRRPSSDDIDHLLAVLDDCAPTALVESEQDVRIFFASEGARDRALACARAFGSDVVCESLLVSDEAWAERSQASLAAVRVGRVVVAPPWAIPQPPADAALVTVTIQPSMGFGTGHHASTRLCLQLLQGLSLAGCSMLDVGTGSGVLALAAWRLGANKVLGLDCDADALTSARENRDLNTAVVELRQFDLAANEILTDRFDVVTANLTGPMLERYAATLRRWVGSGGTLIASGFQQDEEARLRTAFEAAGCVVRSRATEEGWVALGFQPRDVAA